jgi:Rrf2 family protein
MRLSTQSRYGLRAIFDIAYHSGGIETQVKDISRRQGISPRYIEQIFQKLKKAGIIGSKRGPSGGYFLNKKPDEISVGEIIRITEGNLNPVICLSPIDKRKPCEKSGNCVTQIIWNEAGKKLKEYFESITIKDLCEMAKKMGIEREIDKKYMYYI